MLCSIHIYKLNPIIKRRHDYDTAVLQSLEGHILAGKPLKLGLHFLLHLISEDLGIAHKNHLRIRPMLGLRKQVGSHKCRNSRRVRHNQHLGRSCRHIDRYLAGDNLLGLGHIAVARTEYLVNSRNRLRTVCHCGNSLRATYLENTVDSTLGSSIKHSRSHLAILSAGGTKYHLPAASNLGRDSQHEHCRKQRSRSAGDI